MEDKQKYLKYILHVLVIGGVIWAGVRYLNGEEVVNAVQNFDYGLIPYMLLLATTYFLLKAARFIVLISPFTENISKWTVLRAYMAGQAMTLIPGGVAARAALMKQAGVSVAQSSVPVLLHSAWDQTVFLLGGLIAALWFPAARVPVLIILGVLIVVGTLFAIEAVRDWAGDKAESLAKRFDKEAEWERFLDAFPKVFKWKIMLAAFVITVVAFGTNIVTLDLAMRGLELEVAYPTLFLAFIIPTMLGRMVPVPGGFGVTEASMVGFLSSASEVNTNQTVAAVAMFRIATIVFPAFLGMIVYFFFWKGEEEGEEPTTPQTEKNVHASQPDF